MAFIVVIATSSFSRYSVLQCFQKARILFITSWQCHYIYPGLDDSVCEPEWMHAFSSSTKSVDVDSEHFLYIYIRRDVLDIISFAKDNFANFAECDHPILWVLGIEPVCKYL